MNQQAIRIKPKSFDCDWQQDLMALGIKIPVNLSVLQYAPVNHNPIPFSIEIDMSKKTVVKKISGVMPNAAYRGHIYHWDEFMELMGADGAEDNEEL